MKNNAIFLHTLLLFAFVSALLPLTTPAEAAEDTKTISLNGLNLELPASWKKKESNSQFRLGEFIVPAAEGEKEAELILYHFRGAAGSTDDNIKRWIKQFEPKGRKVALKEGKTESGKYVWVDITGNYKQPVGPPVLGKFELIENARVISVILNTDNDVFYLKLVGGQKSIKAQEAAYRKSFGGDAESETVYEPQS